MFSAKNLVTLQPLDRFLKFQCLLVPLFKHYLLSCLPNPLPVSARRARRALRKASLPVFFRHYQSLTQPFLFLLHALILKTDSRRPLRGCALSPHKPPLNMVSRMAYTFTRCVTSVVTSLGLGGRGLLAKKSI